MKELFEFAKTQIGVTETPGPTMHNPIILNYAKEGGFLWVNDDETPWCSIFANYVALKCGYERSKKANARSWMEIGESLAVPEVGCICVFKRGNNAQQGHVGFYAGKAESGAILVLGGNQKDKVQISAYSQEALLGYRKLKKIV